MVIDTSLLLAIFFEEKESKWALKQLEENRPLLRMSTVNLAETLILVEDRQPHLFKRIHEEIFASGIRFVPPTISQAETAAKARLQFPVNLGDCFAYALAKEENCPVLTLDRAFQKTDVPIIIPLKTKPHGTLSAQ